MCLVVGIAASVLGVLFSVLREVHGRYVKYFWIAKGITFDIDDEFV